MNLLTEQEIGLIDVNSDTQLGYARDIEDAVVKKLAGGVAVEPVASFWREKNTTLYPGVSFGLTTAGEALTKGERHQLYTVEAIAAARVQALEEAAGICDERKYHITAGAIRALIGGKQE